MKRLAIRRVVLLLMLVLCAIYVHRAAAPTSSLYEDVLTPDRLLVLGIVAKLACLGAGSVFALRSASRLERSNPARGPWQYVGAWLALWTVAEALGGYYALFARATAPMVTIGDLAFFAGYVPLFVGLVRFIFVYRASGFPLGSAAQHLTIAGCAAAAVGAIAVGLLAPAAAARSGGLPLGERVVAIGYPVLDLAALVPTVVMIRIALAFRPGKVWLVWAALLVGFVSMAAGDVVSAILWSSEANAYNPWIHLTYLLGYFFVASGARLQDELIAAG